jgi:hypothetical protein
VASKPDWNHLATEDSYQIGYVTLDGAANNNAAMRNLSELLQSRGVQFPTEERRIMYLLHILNTCSRHVTKQYHKTEFFNVFDEDWIDQSDNSIDKDVYVEALRRDPINCARRVVKSICASSLCWEAFVHTI